MSSYRHLVYMVLDKLKGMSDDFSYTEDHIIFLLSSYRASILKNTYKNKGYKVPNSNYQTICLSLEDSNSSDGIPCGDDMLRSVEEIPKIIDVGVMSVFPIRFLSGANIAFISKERMNFVGYNKYLQNTIYATIGEDNHLYLKSSNPQFMYLEKVKAYAVFEDVSKAYELGCETENDKCEILDIEFPLEAPLIPILIESVVEDLTKDIYRPDDSGNNAKDDLVKDTE